MIVILFVRSPWGQEIIINKATSYVSDKTGTKVEIEKLFITFSGNVLLDGLYLEDESGDTLLYSGKLETGVAFMPLIRNGNIEVFITDWEGLRAKVKRDSISENFNFDFLINAFVDEETTEEEEVETDPSESSDISLRLSPISIRDIQISYDDQVMGLNSSLSWKELYLKMQSMNLEKMFFEVDEFTFNQAKIDYFQYKPFPESEEDTTESTLPILILHQLNLNQIDLSYESQPDGILAKVQIGELGISLPEADMQDQRIMLESLILKNSNIALEMAETEKTVDPEPAQETADFSWPDWVVEIGNIELENNNIQYTIAGYSPTANEFDPNYIAIKDFTFSAHSFYLKEKEAGGVIDQISFIERSGLHIEDFGLTMTMDEKRFDLEDLNIQSGDSRLKGAFVLNYNSIEELIDQPENAVFDLNISTLESHLREALIFAPELGENPYFEDIIQKGLKAEAKMSGNLNQLNIGLFDLRYGEFTSLNIQQALIRNPTDVDRLYFDIPQLTFESKEGELAALVKTMELGIDLPEEMLLETNATGTMEDLVADLKFESSDGNLSLSGKYQDKQVMVFEAEGDVRELDLGKILEIPELSPISLELKLDGQGKNLEELKAYFAMDFQKLEYGGFDYSSLKIEGNAADAIANLKMQMNHPDLNFDMAMRASLDTINPEYQLDMDMKLVQLKTFGLTDQSVLGSFEIQAEAKGVPKDLSATLNILNGRFVADGRTYPLGEVVLQANLDSTRSSFVINSDFLSGNFLANGSLDKLTTAFNHYTAELLGNGLTEPKPSIYAEGNFAFHPIPLFDQVFFIDLEKMDSLQLDFAFQSDSSLLRAHLELPEVDYAGIEIDTFHLSVDGLGNSLRFSTGFASLTTGPVDMGETFFEGSFMDKVLNVGFISKKEDKKLIQMRTELFYEGDTLNLAFDPDTLILNGAVWNIPEDHRITYAPGFLEFKNFEISQEDHSLLITNSLEEEGDKEHLGIIFNDFRLSTITGFLNPDNPVGKGIMNGKFVVENPFDAIGLVADMSIRELNVLNIPLGTLKLEASAETLGEYTFDLSLKEGQIDSDIYGSFIAQSEGADLDLTLELNSLQMSLLEALSDSAVVDAKGYITGNAKVNGTTSAPEYKGQFEFKEAGFLVDQLNTRFLLEDESINFDQNGLYLKEFIVKDTDGNQFSINGEINTKNISNPGLNLKLNANDFQVMNSTRKDNDMFYGQASIDLDMNITGTASLPDIKTTLRLRENSNVTFIVPEDQLEVVERTGVVLFVDQEDPYDVLEKRQTEIETEGITGFDVNAILEIDPEAVFHLIIDQRSGDNLRLQGEANLNVIMDPAGRISITGEYEVRSGHYELSLFGLVNRKFLLGTGSTITWRGDPLDAALDLRAIYEVKTSVEDLMRAQISGGADSETMGRYKQSFPFLVYLNINGEILDPVISFGLDMPEQSRGALGGSVYSTVRSISEQQDELNRQVFSLLVLNQFYPVGGDDGSTGGSVSLARSSVSQVLSNQLNNFADRLFGDTGFSVDFGVDSYMDYQNGGGTTRTDVNIAAQQRLFDDRLVVQVGSQVNVEGQENVNQETALFGDVSIEYLLTESGRWRAKAFRKNQFASVIDGQLIITGLALIFNREFDHFHQLWGSAPDKTQEENQEENKEEENQPLAPALKEDE